RVVSSHFCRFFFRGSSAAPEGKRESRFDAHPTRLPTASAATPATHPRLVSPPSRSLPCPQNPGAPPFNTIETIEKGRSVARFAPTGETSDASQRYRTVPNRRRRSDHYIGIQVGEEVHD